MNHSTTNVSRRPRVGWLIASLFALLLVVAAPLSASAQTEDDERAFADTGFRVADDSIWAYFNAAGGEGTFGAPVSQAFQLRGVTVQLFQRAVLQILPDGSVGPVALMTTDWLPYTSFNGSTLP